MEVVCSGVGFWLVEVNIFKLGEGFCGGGDGSGRGGVRIGGGGGVC